MAATATRDGVVGVAQEPFGVADVCDRCQVAASLPNPPASASSGVAAEPMGA
jgi:hypothetical protein